MDLEVLVESADPVLLGAWVDAMGMRGYYGDPASTVELRDLTGQEIKLTRAVLGQPPARWGVFSDPAPPPHDRLESRGGVGRECAVIMFQTTEQLIPGVYEMRDQTYGYPPATGVINRRWQRLELRPLNGN